MSNLGTGPCQAGSTWKSRGKPAFAVAAWLPLALVSQYPRYFIPHLAPFCLANALALTAIPKRWVRGIYLIVR